MKKKGFWSVGRLVIGIILMVLSLVIMFQSCAAGIVNTLEENTSDAGGTAGFILAVLMIAAGIVSICTRNSGSKAGPIVTAVLLLLGAIVGLCNAAVYQDLVVWGIVSIVFAIVYIICAIKTKKELEKEE